MSLLSQDHFHSPIAFFRFSRAGAGVFERLVKVCTVGKFEGSEPVVIFRSSIVRNFFEPFLTVSRKASIGNETESEMLFFRSLFLAKRSADCRRIQQAGSSRIPTSISSSIDLTRLPMKQSQNFKVLI